MRASAYLLLIAFACGGKKDDPPPTPAGPAIDWDRCTAALKTATTPDALAAGCPVCDLATILPWHTPPAEGGPSATAINKAMDGCTAFCTGTARERFQATLDEARGINSLTPWKQLGELCKDKVSIGPDTERFAGARWFALDRIARAASAHGGPAADALGKLDIALPALAIGAGSLELPQAAGVPVPVGAVLVTVSATDTNVTRLPHAHLDATGVHRVPDDPYPGPSKRDLGKAMTDLGGERLIVLAPRGLPASRIADLVHDNPDVPAWRIAVAPPDRAFDWKVPAMIEVDVASAGESITVDDKQTVQDLANALVAAKGKRVVLTRRVNP